MRKFYSCFITALQYRIIFTFLSLSWWDSHGRSISSHEKSECMGTGRKKKHRKHPNCPNTKIKKKPLMICCVCGVSSGETNNSLVKCSRCDLVVSLK
jgi:hypothetical protein